MQAIYRKRCESATDPRTTDRSREAQPPTQATGSCSASSDNGGAKGLHDGTCDRRAPPPAAGADAVLDSVGGAPVGWKHRRTTHTLLRPSSEALGSRGQLSSAAEYGASVVASSSASGGLGGGAAVHYSGALRPPWISLPPPCATAGDIRAVGAE